MYSVAIVDDEGWFLDMLNTYITDNEADFTVIGTYLNAQSALAALTASPVDLLISDIRMFGMSGLELVKQVKEQFPRTVVFMLSAYRDFEYARTAIKYGVECYLLKPVDYRELSSSLADAKKRLDAEAANAPKPALTKLDMEREPVMSTGLLVANVKAYIAQNYHRDLSRDDIAKAVFSSSSHLSRIFKQETGTSLMEYLMNYRIETAVDLLKKHQKISDISTQVGYQNYNTFLVHFRQCTGVSPNEYRRIILKMEESIDGK